MLEIITLVGIVLIETRIGRISHPLLWILAFLIIIAIQQGYIFIESFIENYYGSGTTITRVAKKILITVAIILTITVVLVLYSLYSLLLSNLFDKFFK
ncbi:MAG: hypothetical protein ACPLYC_00910 [Minisyncoccia bacterium]